VHESEAFWSVCAARTEEPVARATGMNSARG
jgi:hypothetical protein